MLRIRRGEVKPVTFDEQMPLGMFSDTRYRAQRLTLLPGDRLMILSDGLYGAEGPSGIVYGQAPLATAMRHSRLQNPEEAVRFLIGDLLMHLEGSDLVDDAIAVCLDWNGVSTVPDPGAGAGAAQLARPPDASPDVMT
jgi:serine phosphatase RsbU (regulator of sigma subunit)